MEQKRGWGIAGWVAIVLSVVLIAYPLSVGPATWLCLRLGSPAWFVAFDHALYAPIGWILERCPPNVSDWWIRYQFWWAGVEWDP